MNSKEMIGELIDLYECIIHGDFHVMSEDSCWKRIEEIKQEIQKL